MIDFRFLMSLVCLALGACIQGCGEGNPPAFKTIGHVVFSNGTPVKTGTIELKSRNHPIQARGTIGPKGEFTLTTYRDGDGAIEGVHDCVVVQMVIAEDIAGRGHGSYGVVNPKHASYNSSGLTCTIEPKDGNDITLTVEGLGKARDGGSEKDHKIPTR